MRNSPARRILLVVVVIVGSVSPVASAGIFRRHHQCCPAQPPPPPPKVLKAGDRPEDLQVHVVGAGCEAIEIYFFHEFDRVEFDDTANLHYGGVSLAPVDPNREFAAFAIIHGKGRQKLSLYGWKKDSLKPDDVMRETFASNGAPLRLKWVTTRIVKVWHGTGPKDYRIYRFNPRPKKWEQIWP